MQILEAKDDASGVKDCARFGEHVGMNVHHEVPATRVLHHETNVALQHIKIITLSLACHSSIAIF